MDTFLGFDFGTTSIKATSVDTEGRVLSRAKVSCSTLSPEPGWFEMQPDMMWRRGFEKALHGLGRDIVGKARAVCVSSVCATFVPVDARLNPVYNAILYGIDTRAAKQVERLNTGFAKERIERIAGTGFTSHSVLPKILWLKEKLPEVYNRTALFLESTNYITSLLTARTAWDRPTAAGGHMIDLEQAEYSTDLLVDMGLDVGRFPQLGNPLDVLGEVTAEASAETGIPQGALVLIGACDANAEAFACGAVEPGDLTLVYGSTISTLFTLDSFKNVFGFVTGPSVLKGTYRVGGATSSGGRYLDWLRSILSMTDEPKIEHLSVPTGLIMLPYLDGARIPHQDPHARVTWHGMGSETKREDLYKAAIESMGYEIADILKRFESITTLPSFAHAMGGLSTSDNFLRMVSNITGMPHLRHRDVDASFGDALMALCNNKGFDAVRRITEGMRTNPGTTTSEGSNLIRPDSLAFERYTPYRKKYVTLSNAIL